MKQVRTRDFVYTSDDLYFASTNYIHPENRVISFLRYVPDPEGDREKDGKRYRKVGSEEAYSYLRENYPDYLYFSDVTNVEIKREKIAEKAKEVIEKNLATVQQIACTLGEHMAETEVLLRSIAKDYAGDVTDRPNITIRNRRNS